MAMVVYSADDSIHQEVLTAAQDLLKGQGSRRPRLRSVWCCIRTVTISQASELTTLTYTRDLDQLRMDSFLSSTSTRCTAAPATGADVRVVPRLLESEGSKRALLGRYHSGLY